MGTEDAARRVGGYEEPFEQRKRSGWLLLAAMTLVVLLCTLVVAYADTRSWFNSLRSPGGGVCCYDYDGVKLNESDWKSGDTYSVIIDGKWVQVPPDRVVQSPNLLGIAFEWHYYNNGVPVVRCFIPGNMG